MGNVSAGRCRHSCLESASCGQRHSLVRDGAMGLAGPLALGPGPRPPVPALGEPGLHFGERASSDHKTVNTGWLFPMPTGEACIQEGCRAVGWGHAGCFPPPPSTQGGSPGLLAGRIDGASRWHSRIRRVCSPTSSCGPAHLLDELSRTAERIFPER